MRSAQGGISKVGANRWQVSIELPPDPATGKRRRKFKTVRGSRKDAERAKAEMLAQMGADTGSASPWTFGEYVEQVFLPAKEREVKRLTYSGYESKLKAITPIIADVKLADISPAHVRKVMGSFESPKAQASARRMLSVVFGFAVYDGQIESNPCKRVRPPKAPCYEPEVLDIDGINRYIEAFRGSIVEAAVLIAIGCGLRRGEILALDVEDIGRDGTIKVRGNYLYDGHGTYTDTPKSANGLRTVHMPSVLLGRLLDILPESGPVLPGKDGGRMHPDALTHAFEKVVDELPDGVPRIPFKNLRHTSLTLAYDSGADLLAVSTRAGHSGTGITSRYYVRPKGERDRQIAQAMSQALGGHTETYISENFNVVVIDESTLETF